MTDERKNEIWAMLTEEERCEFRGRYVAVGGCEDFDEGYDIALERVFGKHNLTAQAEEKSPIQSENDNLSTNEDAYFAYRLDLAKEIAVAKMNRQGVIDPREVVEDANEIVKRLKETEI